MQVDLDIMVKAAQVAVRQHVRRPPHSAAGRVKKSNLGSTLGVATKDIASHVDIMKHLSGAAGHGAEELANHYKNMHLSPSHMVGQARLTHAAQTAAPVAQQAAAIASKRTPTQVINPRAVMQHAANTVPAQVIQGAVAHKAPAMGTSTLLDQLSRTSFDKLSKLYAAKLATYSPPNSLTPQHVTDVLAKLKQTTAAKRAVQAVESAGTSVQRARYGARQMGAAVGSSR